MDHKSFATPVFVRAGEKLIQEIASIHDAFDYLDEWPENLRGPIYDTALRACYRAHDGLIPLEVARSAFAGFAKSARILEGVCSPPPWTKERHSSQGSEAA